MNPVQQVFTDVWINRRAKKSNKGWWTANAPCCVHNGETADKRGRGGLILADDGGASYHCFNCGYKATWHPGWNLTWKVRNLLRWMGADDSVIKKLVFDCLKLKDEVAAHEYKPVKQEHSFKPYPLPDKAKSIYLMLNFYSMSSKNPGVPEVPVELESVVSYAQSRGFTDDELLDMYWTPSKDPARMLKRLIIPFKWEGKTVGYTARHVGAAAPKYYTQIDGNYVYGMDNLPNESEYVIVMEGPIDALMLQGVSPLGNTINAAQADIIESSNRKPVVVPDRGKAGALLVEAAQEYGWAVSFPEWSDADVKDPGEAVQKYGRLWTLWWIYQNIEESTIKINLRKKKYFE